MKFPIEGLLALAPSAASLDCEVLVTSAQYGVTVPRAGVALIGISGPLEHHVNTFFDSYDGVKMRVAAACDLPEVQSIMLSIDSPGGVVAGAFDTAREIRAIAKAAGKKLYAYVDAQTASAAYALACVADRIYVPEAGKVGSIGVIAMVRSVARAEQEAGLDYRVISSAEKKAFGNPHLEISDAAVSAVQAEVDATAAIFFSLVGEFRGKAGLTAQKARDLEAAQLLGQSAVDAKLADDLATLEEALDRVSSAKVERVGIMPSEDKKESPFSDAIAALRKISEGEGDDAAKARKALAAIAAKAEGDDSPTKPDEDEPAKSEESDDSAKAESDSESAGKAKASGKARADADEAGDDQSARALALKALGEVHKLRAEAEKTAEIAERAQLLAGRPDFEPTLKKLLATAPVAQVKQFCASLPKVSGTVVQTGAAALSAPHAPVASAAAVGLTGSELEEMAVQMGLKAAGPIEPGVQASGEYAGQFVHPVLTPTQCRAIAARKSSK